MDLLKQCIREVLKALIEETREMEYLSCTARNYVLGIFAFGVATILLLSANVALTTMLIAKL